LLALLFFRQHTKTMTGLRRLIPLLDRVLVERVVAPTKSAGGVLLPESAVPRVRFS
jgi:chaperonin GroES